jgi:paraquat-inducible protein A
MVLISCKNCKKVYKKENYDSFLCNRCNHMVKKRVENSLQISLALTICAMLLYIPAMVYPMMVVTQFGVNLESTIIEGIISFLEHGSRKAESARRNAADGCCRRPVAGRFARR